MQNSCPMIRALLILGLMMVWGCDPPVQEEEAPQSDPYREQFVKVNRYMQKRHQDHISAFIDRVGWDARQYPSGLWIVVQDSGKGPAIVDNQVVTYAFSSQLLDGTPCYEAAADAPKSIIVGKGGVEAGVEEGIKQLNPGARAIFLIPPHLAHGNFGDRDKIPGNSVLIYRIHILDVRPGS